MGCGSSIHVSPLSSLGPSVPASAAASPREESSTSTAGNEDNGDQAGGLTSRAFTVDPEPHKEFLPSISPSAVELACRSTVEKLVPRKAEEIARKEVHEALQRWKDGGQLADIESYSLSVPPSLTRSIEDLSGFLTKSSADYLKAIDGPELHTQIAKAYCIYCWIANNITFDRDLWQAYQSGVDSWSLDDSQAEHVLKRRTAVSNGYANLFKSLATECGMMVEVVHGNIKAWRSQSAETPENDFQVSRKNVHTWNLVSVTVKHYYNGKHNNRDCPDQIPYFLIFALKGNPISQ